MGKVVNLEFLCTKKAWTCLEYRNSFVEHVVREGVEKYMKKERANRVDAYVMEFTVGCYGEVLYIAKYAMYGNEVKELSREFLCS